jgi:hypothetical protein
LVWALLTNPGHSQQPVALYCYQGPSGQWAPCSPNNPLQTSGGGGGGGGTVTQGTTPWVTQEANSAAILAGVIATNTTLGAPFQAGGSIGNAAFGATQSGVWNINAITTLPAVTFASPQPVTGTFWQATQPVSIASMPSTPVTGTFFQATQPVSGTFFQATQPVSIASMPSTPVTGTFWQATQPVSIASMPSTPVTGTFWQATQPVSNTGTFSTQATLSAETTKVIGTVNQGTSPWAVSAASLPLPTGASTSALQTTGNTSLTTINTTLGSPFQAGGSIGNTSFAVTNAGTFAVQAALNAETTKVIGTVNQGTSPWVSSVTGTVTANAGTNLNTSGLALESGGNLAAIETTLVNNAGTTSAPAAGIQSVQGVPHMQPLVVVMSAPMMQCPVNPISKKPRALC